MLMSIYNRSHDFTSILRDPEDSMTPLRGLFERLNEFGGKGFFHIDTGGCRANLSTDHDETLETFFDCNVHVTIAEDDGGGFSPQFEGHAF